MDLIPYTDKNSKFISLAEAHILTGISKDYFRVCIQKGYLRGVKIGRNWTTTKEYLDEYIKKYRPEPLIEATTVSRLDPAGLLETEIPAEPSVELISNIIYPDPSLLASFSTNISVSETEKENLTDIKQGWWFRK